MKSLQFLSATCMGIVFWEYILWLPNEVHVWRKLAGKVRDKVTRQKARPTLGEGLAIWMRYTVVGCAICVGTLDFGRPSSCQAAVTMTWVFGCLSWAGISMLFTMRLYIMYSRSRVILLIFTFSWLGALAVWLAVAASWRATNEPDMVPAGAPWCVQSNTKPWRTANWGAEMAFDLMVLVATLFRLHQLRKITGIVSQHGSSQRMCNFILRSNLGYFAISFLLSLAAFVVQSTVPDLILAQVLTPPTISLTPIVAIRIVFSATNDETIESSLPAPPLPTSSDKNVDPEKCLPRSTLDTDRGAPYSQFGSPSMPSYASHTLFDSTQQKRGPSSDATAAQTDQAKAESSNESIRMTGWTRYTDSL